MNLLKNCWQRRWIRGLVWTSVSIGTGYGLLCAGVNWSGARQLNATLAMIKAEGETLDFRSICNEPIPEAENFCAIPLLKDIALFVDEDEHKGAPAEKRKRLETLELPKQSKSGKLPERPELPRAGYGAQTDLKAWAAWLQTETPGKGTAHSDDAASRVLAALATHDPIVRELASGLDRPKGQWTPEWKTRELPKFLYDLALPHYRAAQNMIQILSLRAVAAARTGDAQKAHEAALILARINQATFNDPSLIGGLVGCAAVIRLSGVISELCDTHEGTAAEFAKLEAALAAIDIHHAGLQACRSEMVGTSELAQALCIQPRTNRPALTSLIHFTKDSDRAFARMVDFMWSAIPRGFFDANASTLLNHQIRYLLKPLRDHDWPSVIQGCTAWEKETAVAGANLWRNPSFFFASFAVSPLSKAFRKLVHTEALTAQAVIACALERHRIGTGEYPETLDSLKRADGSPLPPDVMTGQPMRYRREANGRYTLWSVGFDRRDDGGKRNLDPKNAESTRFFNADYVGDWVWDFPAK